MTYSSGQIILASDLNGFVNTINDIWGVGSGDTGYGQASPLPNVLVGDIIQSSHWTNLRNRILTIANHQATGTTLLPVTSSGTDPLEVGDVITAHNSTTVAGQGLAQMIANVTANRMNAAASSVTLTNNVLTANRTSNWTATVYHEFTVSFADEDAARAYFNSGGQIRIAASRSGGSGTSQNSDWTNLLSNTGSVIFAANSTTQTGTGGAGSAIGYYGLTTSFQQVFTQTGSSAYAANDFTIQTRSDAIAGTRGGKGNVLRFRVYFNDDHTNAWSDNVDGTLSVSVASLRATTHLTIPQPSFATTVAL